MKKFLFLTFLFCNLLRAEISTEEQQKDFEHFPFLVWVGSTYSDPAIKVGYSTYPGFGFIIEADNRDYVITDTHLSQGDRKDITPHFLKYYDKDKKTLVDLSFNNQKIDTLHDKAVFEIPKIEGLRPLAKLSTYELGRYLTVNAEFIPDLDKNAKEAIDLPFTPLSTQTFVPQTHLPFEIFSYPTTGSYAAMIESRPYSYELKRRVETGFDGSGTDVSLYSNIPPGASGLPFISQLDHYHEGLRWVISGIATSTSRNFSQGWVSKINDAISLLPGSAESPYASVAENLQWYSFNGVLNRKGSLVGMKNIPEFSVEEAIFDRQKTGGADRDPTGGGTRHDSGGGTRHDSGGGKLGNVSFIKNGILFQEKGKAPQEVVAFTVYVQSAGNFLVPADMSTMTWLVENFNKPVSDVYWYNLHPIPVGESLTHYMYDYWVYALDHNEFDNPRPALGAFSKFLGFTSYSKSEEFVVEKMKPLDHYEKGLAKVKVSFDGVTENLEVSIKLPWDNISFTLGKHGEMPGKDRFEPMIEVKSSKGLLYQIELDTFLMTSPAIFSFYNNAPYPLKPDSGTSRIKFHMRSGNNEYILRL